MSIGGGSNKSKSTTESTSFDFSRSYLNPMQAGMQENLFNQYQAAIPGFNARQNELVPMGMNLLRQNQQLGQMPLAGMDTLQQFGQVGNPYIEQALGQTAQDIGQQFGILNQQLGGQYQNVGQRGGSRQGIAQGLLASNALDTFQQAATDMRMQGYGMQQQGALDFINAQLANRAQQQAGVGLGLQGINQMASNYFSPFTIGAQIIGAPSVLSQGYGFSDSTSRSKGGGSHFNVGFN